MAKAKRSDRAFINASGEEVDKISEATGARYTLLGVAGGNKDFDFQCGEAGKPVTMLAIFGFHTKIGNVANTVINSEKEPGTADDAAQEIADWLDGLDEGQWREAGAGPRGPKYENPALAHVLHTLLSGKGEAKGDEAHYLERLETDKGYRAKVVANDDVKRAYREYMVAQGKAVQAPSTSSLA